MQYRQGDSIMTQQQIVSFVLSCEPPIEYKIAPGFDYLKWYVNKAVEVTAKMILIDFYHENFKETKHFYKEY